MGELEAAREGRLPQLVELTDIRGDLHSHSTWSLGREEHDRGDGARGEAARPLVHRRHRPLALPARRAASRRRAAEIDKVQEKLGRFKLLKGVEANIKADGSVDVDDDVLADRDWVMASIHSGLRQGPDRARPVRDGQPERRLHRAPHRPQAEPARARGRRPRARRREGARDRDVPRDQRAAGPARPSRRARAARGRGGREDRDLERLARDRRRSRTSSSASRRPAARGSGPIRS